MGELCGTLLAPRAAHHAKRRDKHHEMKFLICPSLQSVCARIGYMHTGDAVIQGRLEAYSCKKADKREKQLTTKLDRQYSDGRQASSLERAASGQSSSLERAYSGFTPVLSSSAPGASPDDLILGESPGEMSGSLGVIPDYSMRKLFINLLLTLTSMYPDYDFSSVKPEEFAEETNFGLVQHSINAALAKAMSLDPSLGPDLWAAIEENIQPKECQIYSYNPDVEASPFGEHSIWSFNYFMFNKSLKRVLFFTASCARPGSTDMGDTDDQMDYDEEGMDEDDDEGQMDFRMEDM